MNPQVGGAAPKAPGIYRIPARMTERGGRSLGLRSFRLLSRRSGCVPAVPYPPLRSFQSGLLQPRRAMIYQPTAITPLTLCLTPEVQFMLTPQPLAPPTDRLHTGEHGAKECSTPRF